MLAVCLVAGVLATAAIADRRATARAGRAGRAGRGAGRAGKAALLVALSPASSWPRRQLGLFAMAAGRLASPPGRRGGTIWPGRCSAWRWATKFYPLLLFGALLLVCLRAGKMRRVRQAFGAGIAAWLVVQPPVAIPVTANWARSTRQPGQEAPTGDRSGTCSSTTNVPVSVTPRRTR